MINFNEKKDCFNTFCQKAGKINPVDYRESVFFQNLFKINDLDEETSIERGTGKTTSIILSSLYDFYIKNNSCVMIITHHTNIIYLRDLTIDILKSLNSSYKNIFDYNYYNAEFRLINLDSKIFLRSSLELAICRDSSMPLDYRNFFNRKIIKD